MARNRIKFHKKGWNEVVEHVIDTEGVDRMKRVADAANADLGDTGYKVSTQGDQPLTKRDYRATVITATEHAKRHNAKHNTLIRHFPKAGGE